MINRRNIVRSLFVALALAGAFLLLHSATRPALPADSCREAIDHNKKQEPAQKMIWETLSQQFFSSI